MAILGCGEQPSSSSNMRRAFGVEVVGEASMNATVSALLALRPGSDGALSIAAMAAGSSEAVV